MISRRDEDTVGRREEATELRDAIKQNMAFLKTLRNCAPLLTDLAKNHHRNYSLKRFTYARLILPRHHADTPPPVIDEPYGSPW